MDVATPEPPVLARDGVPVVALRLVLVALTYAGVAHLSRLLAVEPGYASAVWPPAGMALAAAILWGPSTAPAIAAGSALVNFSIGHVATGGDVPRTAALAIAIGLGAGAQALAGAALIRRALGPGNPLERGENVVALLLLGGPVASVVNASWSVAWLVYAGTIPPSEAAANWWTWWVGDSIGVLLVTPTVLAWTARPRALWRRRWLGVAVPLALALVAVAGLFLDADRKADAAIRADFETHAATAAGALARDLDRAVAFLESAAALMGTLPTVDQAEFDAFAKPWLAANPAPQTLAWARLVPAEARAAVEAEERTSGTPGFRIVEARDPTGRVDAPEDLVEAAPRPVYLPITHVAPLNVSHLLVGFDYLSEPTRRAAVEHARDTGTTTVTGGIALLALPGATGVAMVAPVYGATVPPRTVEDRRRDLRGFVIGIVPLADLTQRVPPRLNVPELRLGIVDVTAQPPSVLVDPGDPRTGNRWSMRHAVGGREWRFDVVETAPPPRSWVGWSVLAAGLGFTGLLAAFVLDLGARATRVELMVQERTADLARANAAMERSNQELLRFAWVASHDMREPLRAIASFAELLEMEHGPKLDAKGRDRLARISRAARRMQTLVDAILAFARVGTEGAPFQPVPLRGCVDVALAVLRPTIEACDAEVVVGDLPVVPCDRAQIVHVFRNLVDNGLRYRCPDRAPRIEISSEHTPDGWTISVRDNGVGLDERHHERVFEMIERIHSGDEAAHGVGMGLAICRRIVERHGGRIWLESVPGEGTVVRFALPARAGDAHAA